MKRNAPPPPQLSRESNVLLVPGARCPVSSIRTLTFASDIRTCVPSELEVMVWVRKNNWLGRNNLMSRKLLTAHENIFLVFYLSTTNRLKLKLKTQSPSHISLPGTSVPKNQNYLFNNISK